MHLIWTILIGFVVGLIARFLMPGDDKIGILLDGGAGGGRLAHRDLRGRPARLVRRGTGRGVYRFTRRRDSAAACLRPGAQEKRLKEMCDGIA